MAKPTNQARSNRFKFMIINENSPNLNLSVQGVPIPGVILNTLDIYVEGRGLSLPDNNITYDPLVVDFMVSEDFREWVEIYQWLVDAMTTESYEQHMHDCVLTILDSHQKPILKFTYFACTPSELAGISMSYQDDSSVLKSSLTLLFSTMKVEVLGGGVVVVDD